MDAIVFRPCWPRLLSVQEHADVPAPRHASNNVWPCPAKDARAGTTSLPFFALVAPPAGMRKTWPVARAALDRGAPGRRWLTREIRRGCQPQAPGRTAPINCLDLCALHEMPSCGTELQECKMQSQDTTTTHPLCFITPASSVLAAASWPRPRIHSITGVAIPALAATDSPKQPPSSSRCTGNSS